MKYSTFTSRFSAKLAGFVLVAILSLGVTASSVRLHAQEAAQTAQKAPAAQRDDQQEKTENRLYRHTPIVRAIARTFHLDVETTATSIEIGNFVILALFVLIPLIKVMPKLFRKRSETLRNDLESARKVTSDANSRLSAVEARLAKLDSEIEAIRTQVEAEAKTEETRIKSTIEEERTRIVAAAEQEIAAAAAQAKRGLRHFAADLAIDQASRQLVLTPETDRALIAEFVRDSSVGGKN